MLIGLPACFFAPLPKPSALSSNAMPAMNRTDDQRLFRTMTPPWAPTFLRDPGRPAYSNAGAALARTRSTLLRPAARVKRVAKPVAEQVERQCGEQDREARPQHEQGLREVVLRGRREQIAPAGVREGNAETEIREPSFEEDVARHD